MLQKPINDVPPAPGSVLRKRVLEGLGITQTELADALGLSRPRLHMILTGRLQVTPEVALRLEKALGTSAGCWLQLRADYELFMARRRLRQELAEVIELDVPKIVDLTSDVSASRP
jgi:addiction module HigA family antidote